MLRKITPDNLASGITSTKYIPKGPLAGLCALIALDYWSMKYSIGNSVGDSTVALLIILAVLYHAILTGAYIKYKKCFQITVTAKTLSWKAPFREFSAPLEEVAFLGTTVDSDRAWLKNSFYNRDTIIHLLYGDSHIQFNPECFYTNYALYERVGSYEEQAAWKSTDEIIIAHFKQYCKRSMSEEEKKKIRNRHDRLDFLKDFVYIPVWSVPFLPVLLH